MQGINYITNSKGKKTAVIIELKHLQNLASSTELEDFLDNLRCDQRTNEPAEDYNQFRQKLIQKGKLKA